MGSAVGYRALLRNNAGYRSIWLGALVSLAGDWFTTVALFSMLLELTGKAEAVGFALIARFLPSLIFGALAGVVADRFSRKRVMVICDLLRAVVVLGFLLVKTKEDVPLAMLLTFLQLSVSAFFEPAEQAAIGSVARPEEVVTANTLHAVTWSAMLAVGAMLGGLVAATLGASAAFMIDSASFLCSALLIGRARIPLTAVRMPITGFRSLLGVDALLEGLGMLRRDRRVRGLLLAKAGWGLAGGGSFLLYSIFGERVFPVGATAATGIGVLYGARGFGALIGPLLARHYGGDGEPWLEKAIGWSFWLALISYAAFAAAPNLWLATLALTAAHMGVSTIWVFSNALVNLWVPDRLRGRVFAADMTTFTLALTVSAALTGHALDGWGLSPRLVMLALAATQILPILAWRARSDA